MAKLGRRGFLRGSVAALALAVPALALGGCGFRPLYGERSSSASTAKQLASINIAPIPERIGQQLRNNLRLRLTPNGAPSRADYILEVGITELREDLAIRDDASATLGNLQVRATYRLRQASDGAMLTQGLSRSAASYNIVRSQFASLVAEDDARNRAVEAISEDIRLRLGLYFDGLDRKKN